MRKGRSDLVFGCFEILTRGEEDVDLVEVSVGLEEVLGVGYVQDGVVVYYG